MSDNSASHLHSRGVIVLQGSFVTRHKTALLELVRTTECLSFLVDESARIERITEDGEHLIVETTEGALAVRIGERICAVCGGTVARDASKPDDARQRFIWTRGKDNNGSFPK